MRGAQRLLLEACGAGASGGRGQPPGQHTSARQAARCPGRPHTQGPREVLCPDGPTCACRPPPGPADWPSGAWRGPRLSRSTAPRGRPGHWASGLRAKIANLTCPEPLLWALVMDTQETPTNTSPLGSTPPLNCRHKRPPARVPAAGTWPRAASVQPHRCLGPLDTRSQRPVQGLGLPAQAAQRPHVPALRPMVFQITGGSTDLCWGFEEPLWGSEQQRSGASDRSPTLNPSVHSEPSCPRRPASPTLPLHPAGPLLTGSSDVGPSVPPEPAGAPTQQGRHFHECADTQRVKSGPQTRPRLPPAKPRGCTQQTHPAQQTWAPDHGLPVGLTLRPLRAPPPAPPLGNPHRSELHPCWTPGVTPSRASPYPQQRQNPTTGLGWDGALKIEMTEHPSGASRLPIKHHGDPNRTRDPPPHKPSRRPEPNLRPACP